MSKRTIVVAGGCFWCLDAVYQQIKGVTSSVVGYAGGDRSDANYDSVATGMTRHAEAVQITFDDEKIPTSIILDLFFMLHDPTTKDRQGNDVGPQYRSVVFYKDDLQKQLYEEALSRAQSLYSNPIVTEIVPLEAFYEAEPEHQDYFARNPERGYCQVVIAPKVAQMRRLYASWLR